MRFAGKMNDRVYWRDHGLWIILPLFLMACLHTATGHATMKKTLTPRISVQEQYDDNIDLQPDDENSDWITLVAPGISLALEGEDTSMNLDYQIGFSFYADDSSRDSTTHQAQAAWEQRVSEHLHFHLFDNFVRSEDPVIAADGEIEDIRRDREIYYRNVGETSLSYQFRQEDAVTAGYRNRYLDDTSSRDEDSIGHEGFMNVDSWLTPQYGIGLTSHCTDGQFEVADDFRQYGAGITASYRWETSRRVYGRYDFLHHDFDEAATATERNDYEVHQGVLGMSVQLGTPTELSAEAGYYLQDYIDEGELDGIVFSGGLKTHVGRTSLNLAASGGYGEDYFSSENLGSSSYRKIMGSVDHLVTENLRIFASASYRWEEFFGADTDRDRKDEVWLARGGLSYSFWRWLTLSLEGAHMERDSDDPTAEFVDNRVTLRLTAAYPSIF